MKTNCISAEQLQSGTACCVRDPCCSTISFPIYTLLCSRLLAPYTALYTHYLSTFPFPGAINYSPACTRADKLQGIVRIVNTTRLLLLSEDLEVRVNAATYSIFNEDNFFHCGNAFPPHRNAGRCGPRSYCTVLYCRNELRPRGTLGVCASLSCIVYQPRRSGLHVDLPPIPYYY